MTDIRIIGFSGPDGSGKSTLLKDTAARAHSEGLPVFTIYLYGCVVCRRGRLPRRLRNTVSGRGTIALETSEKSNRLPPSALQRLHAHADTTELALRLKIALWRIRRTRRSDRCPVLLLTDRTPLDGLVKHDLPEDAYAVRRLQRLLQQFTTVVLLDAGGDVLSQRDGEHTTRGLELTRTSYQRWSTGRGPVLALSTQGRSSQQLACALIAAIRDRDTESEGQARIDGSGRCD